MINIRRVAEHITLGILDFEGFANENRSLGKRETERKATGLLLKKLYGERAPELSYNPQGKPFLINNSDHISISHSHGKLCILINQKESCGVDVELIREKILNIKHKFLSEEELIFADDDITKLTTLWAAKESIYKAYGLKEVDFIRHMKIESWNDDSSEFSGHLQKDSLQKKIFIEARSA